MSSLAFAKNYVGLLMTVLITRLLELKLNMQQFFTVRVNPRAGPCTVCQIMSMESD